MAGQSQKLKIIYLMRILLEETDSEHTMTAEQLAKAVSKYGVSAERKSIYTDIEALQVSGMDIIQNKGKNAGYYVGKRDFEIAELKLLVDAVQSSKFITVKKSKELIKKLEGLTSKYKEKMLHRQVFIANRAKTENETIFYNVDYIHTSILYDRQICFKYTEWGVDKKLQLKKNGAIYQVSPWALTWDDENYYLIAYDSGADSIKHYRVDKMKEMHVAEEKRLGKGKFQDFDLPIFAKKTFGMYGGRDEKITFICENRLAGVVIDRFGTDIMMIPVDEEHFKVTTLVAVSNQFFGWVTAIGNGMKIEQPEKVKEEYRSYLSQIISEY